MMKETEKKQATPLINPDTNHEVREKMSSSLFTMFLALVRNFEESFDIQVHKCSSKEPTSSCTLKIKFHHN